MDSRKFRTPLAFFGLLSFGLLALFFLTRTDAFAQDPNGDLPEASAAREQLEFAKNSFIFVFHDSVPGGGVSDWAHALASQHGGAVRHVYKTALKGFSATLPPEAAAALARNPHIAYYEQDQIFWAIGKPSGSGKPPKNPSPRPTQETPWGITRVCGTSCGPYLPDGTSQASAWIIDTGVDLDHPDLNVDVARGKNFVSFGKNSMDDGNGHGTHVAGIIAAKNDGYDVVGVAPGAWVVPVRVLGNNGSGFLSDVIAGVDYVASNADLDDVANMSLGGGPSSALDTAVRNASSNEIYFTLAAGNESDSANNHSPARANGDYIFTISAIDGSDNFAWFSNYGNPPVDYAAPGVSILSLYKGGGMETLSGTSMAAPHVAGLLLLGPVHVNGNVTGDPDGSPDPIAHY
jgi:hypothetical protein